MSQGEMSRGEMSHGEKRRMGRNVAGRNVAGRNVAGRNVFWGETSHSRLAQYLNLISLHCFYQLNAIYVSCILKICFAVPCKISCLRQKS